VLARHRLQRLCWEARLHTRSGRLPLIMSIRPTKVGERAHVLCRAGICAEDFEAHIGEIRAACYARDARVTRHARWSQLVTIDIVKQRGKQRNVFLKMDLLPDGCQVFFANTSKLRVMKQQVGEFAPLLY